MTLARQCVLRSPTGGSLVTWLPAEHAISGRRVTLKLPEGGKSPPLCIETVYPLALPLERVLRHARDWTKSTDYVRGLRP